MMMEVIRSTDTTRDYISPEISKEVCRLDFSEHKLYGRDLELDLLTDALERISTSNRSEVVTLRGRCGSGKTELAEQLRMLVTKSGGFFCVAKFDHSKRNLPHDALADAFNDICRYLLQTDDLETLRKSLNTQLGGDTSFLQRLIPDLASVLDKDDLKRSGQLDIQGYPRLNGACRRFLNAVAAPNRPVVIFLDDLQHANTGTMQLIENLITDRSSKHVLLVASYNDGVPGMLLAGGDREWPMTNIEVENLSLHHIVALVSDQLKLPMERVQTLCEVILQKTQGNPYHVIEILQLMKNDGMIAFSVEKGEWEWDMDLIQTVPNSLHDLLLQKIQPLDDNAKYVLQIAALMGSMFDQMLLKGIALTKSLIEAAEVDRILSLAIEKSVLKIGSRGEYNFTHDLIRETICKMIPERSKDDFHYVIGSAAGEKLKGLNDEADLLLFMSVDHINQSRVAVGDPSEQKVIAQRNVDAAARAMSKSALICAIYHLDNALLWIDGGDWKIHYELTLNIHILLAKTYNGIGDIQQCDKAVDLVLQKAQTFEDKLQVYYTKIQSLSCQGKHDAVIDLCLKVLHDLGEKLPRKVSKTQLSFDAMRTKRKLKGLSDTAILLLSEMRDVKKLAVMKLLQLVGLHAFYVKHCDLMSLAVLRGVLISLSNGRCDMSAFIFSCYSMLQAYAGSGKEAYRFGELAMKLMEISSMKGGIAQTSSVACLYGLHWGRNLQDIVDPLTAACRVGNAQGDIDWAILCGGVMLAASFSSGRHLFEVEEEGRALSRDMSVYYSHKRALTPWLPFWQGALNMTARDNQAFILTGAAMNQHEFIEFSTKENNVWALQTMYHIRLQLACYFRSWDLALEMAEKLEDSPCKQLRSGSFFSCQEKFFTGLTYIAVDRRNGAKKYQKEVNKILKELKKSSYGSLEPLILLLEAEVASLQTNKTGLKKAYDDAIASAEAKDLVNMRALANESAGMVFLDYDNYLSDQYLSECLEYYFQWGAMAKVDQLESDHKSLQSKPKVVTSVASSRGSRTNSTTRRGNMGSKTGDSDGGSRARGKSGRVMLFKK